MTSINPISLKLSEIKDAGRTGLMMHVVVGYPTLNDTSRLVELMDKCGVDLIELQIPFSDPLADGPTIMKACEVSLAGGFQVRNAFKLASELSEVINVPLIFMAYYNTVFKYGVEKFCRDAKRSGVSGLIVPDAAIEEEGQEHFIKYCRKYGLCNIRVISPVSTDDRLLENSKVGSGFVYCMLRQGVTGARKNINLNSLNYLAKLQNYFEIPIAAGFGVSTREHVNLLSKYCDVVVVGSAFVNVISKSNKGNLLKNAENFINGLQGNSRRNE